MLEEVIVTAQIPNLQTSNTTGDGLPIFSLRGVSMSDFSLNQSSLVASYVDEVYKGNAAIQGVQIYDLERMEVLKDNIDDEAIGVANPAPLQQLVPSSTLELELFYPDNRRFVRTTFCTPVC